VFATLLFLAAAAASADPQPATPPVQHSTRMQIFVAPSGELFEAPADLPYPVADWFAGADTNHDGKLMEAEFDADFLRFFAKLDLDRDGVINGKELEQYEIDLAPELHSASYSGWGSDDQDVDENGEKRARRIGSYMAGHPVGAGRFGLLQIPEPVAAMDVTLRGRISRQDAQDAADYRFSLLDSQQRGYLLLADLPRTYAQGRGDFARKGRRPKG
jgi:hypothetical protein